MRQRTTGIAALLILFLTLPLSRACVMVAGASQDHHACCQRQAVADAYCWSTVSLCCAAHLPVDAATFPVQNIASLVPPTQSTAVFDYDRPPRPKPVGLARFVPAPHAPPGLLIAETVVLRI